MLNLPDELKLMCLNEMGNKTLAKMRETSKQFRELCDDEILMNNRVKYYAKTKDVIKIYYYACELFLSSNLNNIKGLPKFNKLSLFHYINNDMIFPGVEYLLDERRCIFRAYQLRAENLKVNWDVGEINPDKFIKGEYAKIFKDLNEEIAQINDPDNFSTEETTENMMQYDHEKSTNWLNKLMQINFDYSYSKSSSLPQSEFTSSRHLNNIKEKLIADRLDNYYDQIHKDKLTEVSNITQLILENEYCDKDSLRDFKSMGMMTGIKTKQQELFQVFYRKIHLSRGMGQSYLDGLASCPRIDDNQRYYSLGNIMAGISYEIISTQFPNIKDNDIKVEASSIDEKGSKSYFTYHYQNILLGYPRVRRCKNFNVKARLTYALCSGYLPDLINLKPKSLSSLTEIIIKRKTDGTKYKWENRVSFPLNKEYENHERWILTKPHIYAYFLKTGVSSLSPLIMLEVLKVKGFTCDKNLLINYFETVRQCNFDVESNFSCIKLAFDVLQENIADPNPDLEHITNLGFLLLVELSLTLIDFRKDLLTANLAVNHGDFHYFLLTMINH